MKLHHIENADDEYIDVVGISSDDDVDVVGISSDDDADVVGNTGDDNINCVIGAYVSIVRLKLQRWGMYPFLK